MIIPESVKKALSQHKLKKFIALIMSMALWVYVMGAQNPNIEDSYRVTVRLKNTPANYKAFYEEQSAKVKLSAPRSYFIDYSENDIHAYVDVSQCVEEGEYDLPIEAEYPKGAELNAISPKTVHVKIEPIIERQMELQLILSGSPKPNTVVKTVESVKNISVVGPKNMLENVKKVVGYVGIVGEENDFELDVPLTAVDENGREVPMVRIVPSTVKAFVDIEAGAKKTVPIVADIIAPEGKEVSKITISPANIEIEGLTDTVKAIDSIKTVTLKPSADKKIFRGNLKLEIPQGIKTAFNEVSIMVEMKDN